MGLHYISFCIKTGSAKRKAKPILWTDVIKPSISVGFFCSYGHNDIRLLRLFSSGGQWQFFTSAHTLLYSFPPACTSWHTRSHIAFQWDMKQHLPQISPSLSPSSFPSTFPAIAGKVKTLHKKVEGGGGRNLRNLTKHIYTLWSRSWIYTLEHTLFK